MKAGSQQARQGRASTDQSGETEIVGPTVCQSGQECLALPCLPWGTPPLDASADARKI
jgi:hypothetical protein